MDMCLRSYAACLTLLAKAIRDNGVKIISI